VLDVLDPSRILGDELVERREAGYELDGIESDARDALASGDAERIERAYDRLLDTSMREGWPYVEPTSLDEIRGSYRPSRTCPRCG
jgi:hypothetical protein